MGAVDDVVRPTRESGAGAIQAIWRGHVGEVYSDGSVQIIVPRLGGLETLGRIPAMVNGLERGTRVLVAAVEGRKGDMVVVSRLNELEPVIGTGHFTDVTIDNDPTLPEHATRKDYVDEQVATRAPLIHTHLWDDITNPPATFPPSAHTHDAADVVSGKFDPTRLPLVTSSADGAMVKADKVKLDGATPLATPGTLALRDGRGKLQTAAPTIAADAANRGYVDTQDALRALKVHRHTYADIDGVVPTSALPSMAITDIFTVDSQAEMLALEAERGDMAIRSDTPLTFALAAEPASVLGNWKQIQAAGQVVSVNGKTGVVLLSKGDVGLGAVDNTPDTAKPVSAAMQVALNGKAPTAHTHAAADIVSGVLVPALLPAATVNTQGALSAIDKAKLDALTNDAYVQPSLAGTFYHYIDPGNGWTGVWYRRVNGWVTVHGAIRNNSAWAANTVILTLPVGFRAAKKFAGVGVVAQINGKMLITKAGAGGEATDFSVVFPV